jgi:hypothetical protein
MKELKIFDKRKNIKAIIGLNKLLEVINNINADILCGKWKIYKGSSGYGEDICKLEDSLEDTEFVEVEGNVFFKILLKGEQYFYHLEMEKSLGNIGIGIFDSTFLYIKSNDLRFIEAIKSNFIETEIVDLR